MNRILRRAMAFFGLLLVAIGWGALSMLMWKNDHTMCIAANASLSLVVGLFLFAFSFYEEECEEDNKSRYDMHDFSVRKNKPGLSVEEEFYTHKRKLGL